jgi:hypothetical protein
MTEEEIDSQKKRKRELIAETLEKMLLQYKAKDYGESMQVIGALLEGISTAVQAKTIRTAAPSIVLSLKFALIGVEKEKSEAGVLGKSLNKVIDSASGLIINHYLKEADSGSRSFFRMLMKAFYIILVSAFSYFKRLDLNENDESEDKESNQLFGFELITLMILSTEALDIVLKKLVEIAGIKEKDKKQVLGLIKAVSLFLIIWGYAKGENKIRTNLLIDLKKYLISDLKETQTVLNQVIGIEKNEDLLLINNWVKRALNDLQEENSESFSQINDEVLAYLQTSELGLNEEFELLEGFSKVIEKAFNTKMQMGHLTASHLI